MQLHKKCQTGSTTSLYLMNVEMPFTEIFYTSSNNNKAILSFLAEADQKLEICRVDFVEGGGGAVRLSEITGALP